MFEGTHTVRQGVYENAPPPVSPPDLSEKGPSHTGDGVLRFPDCAQRERQNADSEREGERERGRVGEGRSNGSDW